MITPKGSIERRGKNSWRISIPDPHQKGKDIRRTFSFPAAMDDAQQRAEADIELQRLRLELHDSNGNRDRFMTFQQLYDLFMDLHANPDLKPNSARFYADMNTRILPALGEMRLCDMTPVALTSWLVDLKTTISLRTKRPLADSTVRHHYDAVKIVLEKAVQWDIITSNPMDKVDRPRVRRREMKFYDEAQIHALLDKLGETEDLFHFATIVIALTTGCRLGEVAGLKWSDVDFDRKELHINRSRNYLPGLGIYEDDPKSDAGIRTICIPDGTMAVLGQLHAEHQYRASVMGERWLGDGHIITTWDGKPLHPDTPSKWWRKFLRKSGLPPIRFHDIRHTHATAIFPYVDLLTLSVRMGHSDPTTTLRDYGHSTKERDRKAAEAIDRLIFSKES